MTESIILIGDKLRKKKHLFSVSNDQFYLLEFFFNSSLFFRYFSEGSNIFWEEMG